MSSSRFFKKWRGRGAGHAAAVALLWASTANLPAQSNRVLELTGYWTNSFSKYATAIQVTNGIAYLGYEQMEILDVHDPGRPAWLASYTLPEGWTLSQIEVLNGLAFLALNVG